MALKILSTQELADQALSNLETALNQTAPLNEKAFLRVLAAVEALTATGLYKFAAERARQTLALTATGSDLDLIGAEFNVIRKPAAAAVLAATLPGLDGTIIPATSSFIGDANKVSYFMSVSVEIIGGFAELSITAEELGVNGNLQVGDTLTIVSPVAGADQTATVTEVTDTGAEEETDEAYRQRVLFAERSTPGGNNTTDYKIWSEGAEGVFRAFPYAGKPPALNLVSFPGDRTVFVEADSSIDPDGIAPQSLLDDVRDDINSDPVTTAERASLGLEDSTLYVESITRTGAIVEVKGLRTPSGQEAGVKADIEEILSTYFRAISPFIEGIDLPQNRNDLITDLTVANTVQEALSARSSSATGVRFRLLTTPWLIDSSYRLEPGELTKLDSTVYVA